jgi:glycosyltransferase involved in cell wall biosynthesis
MATVCLGNAVLVANRSPRESMSFGTRRKVLVYSTGPLGDRLAGPEIRALQHANALRADYEVTLMAQRPDCTERDGLPVVPSSRKLLIREARRNDVIVSPCLPPHLLVAKRLLGFTAISDKYDPYEVELVALENECHDRELRLHSLSLTIDLRCADVVLCAAEQQRENLIAATGKLDRSDQTRRLEPVVVPFGIPDPPPESGRRPLRDRFAQIRDDDTVVLWWGAVWKWLDAETPIRAFAHLADSRPDLKFVITAGAPPSANNQRFEAVSEARELARALGVLNRNVLFLDEWVPYEQRWDYLREADIGLTLHRFSAEAALAARSRYVDYLSAGLPCVLGRGDQTASEFEAAGFATLVDHPEPAGLADLIATLAADRTRLKAAATAGRELAAERHTSTTAEKLRSIVASATNTDRSRGVRGGSLTLAGTVGFYYAHKLADLVYT